MGNRDTREPCGYSDALVSYYQILRLYCRTRAARRH
jgi:hypothetical protein